MKVLHRWAQPSGRRLAGAQNPEGRHPGGLAGRLQKDSHLQSKRNLATHAARCGGRRVGAGA